MWRIYFTFYIARTIDCYEVSARDHRAHGWVEDSHWRSLLILASPKFPIMFVED